MSDVSTVEDTGDAPAAAPAGTKAAAEKATAAAPAANGKGGNGAAQPAGSLATGAEVVAPAAPADWPTDWRERMANEVGDRVSPEALKKDAKASEKATAKELERLQRFASPAAVWTSQRELENKLTGLVKVPGAKATDEERAAFAKALGVPEKPEDYGSKIKLANNRVLGEADKPVLDSIAAKLHPLGVTPGQLSAIVDWKLDYDQAAADQREEADGTYRVTSEKALRAEWGGDYKPNTTAIAAFVADAPPEVRDIMGAGRDQNGNKLGDHPVFLKWLRDIATELYPAAQNYAADGSNPAGDELAALRKKAQMTPREYTKADEARQTLLIEQQQAAGKRGRRAA